MAEGGGDNKGLVKASLKDSGFVLLLLVLGAFQYGWLFWPNAGFLWGLANTLIILCILSAAIAKKLSHNTKRLAACFIIALLLGIELHGTGVFSHERPVHQSEQKHSQKRSDQESKKVEDNKWRDVFNDPTAIFTFVIAVFTGGLYVATARLVRGADETSKRELRAYVSGWPEFVWSFDASHFARIRFKVLNIGETLAYVRHRCDIGIGPYPVEQIDLPILKNKWTDQMVLFPNLPFYGFTTCGRLFTAAEIQGIQQSTSAIYIIGEIEYRDIFSAKHFTKFCSIVRASEETLLKLTTNYLPSDLDISFQVAPVGNDAN